MPGGDGTGPMGFGPMTGRAAGYCAGYPVPGFMNPWGGRGFGRGLGRGWGRGLGRGWGRGRVWGMPFVGYPPTVAPMGFAPWGVPTSPTPADEADALKRQAQFLNESLEQVRKRLSELEAEAAKQ